MSVLENQGQGQEGQEGQVSPTHAMLSSPYPFR